MYVNQNPTTVSVSAPYPDTRKVGRDGTHEWLVTVRADESVASVRFPTQQDAIDFHAQDRIEDVLAGAFAA
jgi:hypothetical protein